MEPRWLTNAPIVEALVSIDTEHARPLTRTDLLGFEAAVKDRYPERKAKFQLTASVVGDGTTLNTEPPAIQGFLYRKTDKTQVVHARIDGFAFSRLRPYVPWDKWLIEAKEMWNIYKSVTAPIGVNSISVRTLNSLKLPIGIDMKNFMHVYPEVEIASGLPQKVAGFSMRVILPHEEPRTLVVLNQTALATTDPDAKHLELSIDIDVQRSIKGEITDEELWRQMDELRIIKNETFFKLLTDSALGQYV